MEDFDGELRPVAYPTNGKATPTAFNPGSMPIPTPSQVTERMRRLETEGGQRKKSYSRQAAAKSGDRMFQAQLRKEQNLMKLQKRREQEILATLREKPAICQRSVRLCRQRQMKAAFADLSSRNSYFMDESATCLDFEAPVSVPNGNDRPPLQ